MNRLLRLALPVLVLGSLTIDAQAGGHRGTLGVAVDHAKIIEINRPAATVIIGNPAIVDVEVLNSERLVLTGRSYGITNIVILDEAGKMILDEQVAVRTFENKTVRVYRQASRITYACAPKCEPTVTIGDDQEVFQRANQQYVARQAMATEAATR